MIDALTTGVCNMAFVGGLVVVTFLACVALGYNWRQENRKRRS